MRLAFLILLFCNLVFFVWGQGYLGSKETGREPLRLVNQLHPEKIKLIAAPTVEPMNCRLIGGLIAAQATALGAAVSAIDGWKFNLLSTSSVTEYWVLIPALPNDAMAEKKLAEVRQLGIADAKSVRDESNGPFVVSLGLFRTSQAAQDYLELIGGKGVRSAKMLERPRSSRASAEIRAPAADLAKRLEGILEPFNGATVAECAAT